MTERVALQGTAAALYAWFDARFSAMAIEAGAEARVFPASIPRDTLAQAGYLEAFPDGATPLDDGRFLPPAVCYHAYAENSRRQLEQPLLLTAAQTCFREADRASDDPLRLWQFSMREIIFIGPRDWVASERRRWTTKTMELAAALALDAALEPATDPFFGDISRGRRLMQQLKHLKDELRLRVDARHVAVASFNSHETFFGSRFDIRLADGTTASSGCAAFGLERWTLAFLAQRGEQAAAEVLKL